MVEWFGVYIWFLIVINFNRNSIIGKMYCVGDGNWFFIVFVFFIILDDLWF